MKNLAESLSSGFLKGLACITTCLELSSWEAEHKKVIEGMWLAERILPGEGGEGAEVIAVSPVQPLTDRLQSGGAN